MIPETLGICVNALVCLRWDWHSVLPVRYLGFNAVFVMRCRVAVGPVVSRVGFARDFFVEVLPVAADHLSSDHYVVVHESLKERLV